MMPTGSSLSKLGDSSARPQDDSIVSAQASSKSDDTQRRPLLIDTDKRSSLIARPPHLWQIRASSRILASRSNVGLDVLGGALKGFTHLPLDVIYETAMYLHPKDLLALSRLSQQLRAIFLSRTASSVWREVMKNISELPACPRDLTGPEYASFVFDVHCMACGYPGINLKALKSYPTLRLRLCTGCAGLNLISGHILDRELRTITEDDDELLKLLSIIPSSDSLYMGFPSEHPFHIALSFYYFKPEADIIIQEYHTAKSKGQLDVFMTNRRHAKLRMTAEGRAIAPLINPNILGVNFSRRSCNVKIHSRPQRKRRR